MHVFSFKKPAYIYTSTSLNQVRYLAEVKGEAAHKTNMAHGFSTVSQGPSQVPEIMLPKRRGAEDYDFVLNVRLIGPDFIAGNWLVSRLQSGYNRQSRNAVCKLQLNNTYVDDQRGKIQVWQDVALSSGPRPWFIKESDVLGDMYDAEVLNALDGVMLVYYVWSKASFEHVKECCVRHQKVGLTPYTYMTARRLHSDYKSLYIECYSHEI